MKVKQKMRLSALSWLGETVWKRQRSKSKDRKDSNFMREVGRLK